MSDPVGEGVPLSDEQLLLDALYREPRAWARLTRRLDPFLWSIARRRLADLPRDLQEEFLQEVWMQVAFRAPDDFDDQSQTARAFVGQFVSTAINKVRADYCPPGRRTRDRSAGDELVPLAGIGPLEDERAASAFSAIDARLDVERFVSVATPAVQVGIRLSLQEDLTVTAAARRACLARETFRRQLCGLPRELILIKQRPRPGAALRGFPHARGVASLNPSLQRHG